VTLLWPFLQVGLCSAKSNRSSDGDVLTSRTPSNRLLFAATSSFQTIQSSYLSLPTSSSVSCSGCPKANHLSKPFNLLIFCYHHLSWTPQCLLDGRRQRTALFLRPALEMFNHSPLHRSPLLLQTDIRLSQTHP